MKANNRIARSNLKLASVILFLLFTFSYGYVHQSIVGGNQASRLDLLHAMFQHGTVKIDAYHENTPDKAAFQGHYYSDKAPGTVLVGAPAFFCAKLILDASSIQIDSEQGWLISSWVTCAASIGIATSLGGVVMFLYLCRWIRPRLAALATLGLFLGAAPMPYATMLFSHGLVVACISLALYLTAVNPGGIGVTEAEFGVASLTPSVPKDILAGCAMGLAISSEYTAALAAGGILAVIASGNLKRAYFVVLGAIPPICLIPAYHYACFGDPFTIAYGKQAVFVAHQKGLYGITFPPDLTIAFDTIFGSRGLFVWSPIFLLVFPGYLLLYTRSRRLFWLTCLVPFSQVLVMAGYYDEYAGGTIGPRYLSPVLPLLLIPTALALERFPRFGSILVAVSMLFTITATIVDANRLVLDRFPLIQFYLPKFWQGYFARNIGHVVGLSYHWSVAPMGLILTLALSSLFRCALPARTRKQ